MSADEIRINDVGTIFVLTIKDQDDVAVDISGATGVGDKEFIFRKPSGISVVKDASFVTDGTDGKLKYTTIANDLNVVGDWRLQAHVALGTGDWRSDILYFKVHENLPET